MILFSEGAPRGPSKEQVVSLLKDIHTSPAEAIELYALWKDSKQREMDESHSEYSRLKYNIEVAELLVEANLFEDAEDYCNGAWAVVTNELQQAINYETPAELIQLLERLDIISKQF